MRIKAAQRLISIGLALGAAQASATADAPDHN